MQTSTSTNLFVDNRWNTSANTEGDIKFLREGVKPVVPAICIKRWQNLEFMPLDELSAAHWMRHREAIANFYKPPVESEEKKDAELSFTSVPHFLERYLCISELF